MSNLFKQGNIDHECDPKCDITRAMVENHSDFLWGRVTSGPAYERGQRCIEHYLEEELSGNPSLEHLRSYLGITMTGNTIRGGEEEI